MVNLHNDVRLTAHQIGYNMPTPDILPAPKPAGAPTRLSAAAVVSTTLLILAVLGVIAYEIWGTIMAASTSWMRP